MSKQRHQRKVRSLEEIQRMFEEMGLGTEEERRRFRDLAKDPYSGEERTIRHPKYSYRYIKREIPDDSELQRKFREFGRFKADIIVVNNF